MTSPADDLELRQLDEVLIAAVRADNLLSLTEVTTIGNRLNVLAAESPARHFVVDLQQVRYAGSAALGMLISLTKSLQERGRRLILVGTEHIDSLLKISRTRAVFEVAPTAEIAVAILKKP